MFTGIIECTGEVTRVISNGSNQVFWVRSAISPELKKDQSVSHDGVCLTVEAIEGDQHRVTAIRETLDKSNLGQWVAGSSINLERSLQLSDRLDGHIVQGHVDATGKCTSLVEKNGSWEIEISFPKKMGELIVEKGSICVNGISLTAFKVKRKRFTVAVIPYTFEHTNIKTLKEGDSVNLEFDIIGKYLLRKLSLSGDL